MGKWLLLVAALLLLGVAGVAAMDEKDKPGAPAEMDPEAQEALRKLDESQRKANESLDRLIEQEQDVLAEKQDSQ